MPHNAQRILRDNGSRSFVPPCFKWDLIDPTTKEVVEVASEVDLSQLGVSQEKAGKLYSELAQGNHTVEGTTTPYEVGTSGERGLRFSVTKVID